MKVAQNSKQLLTKLIFYQILVWIYFKKIFKHFKFFLAVKIYLMSLRLKCSDEVIIITTR